MSAPIQALQIPNFAQGAKVFGIDLFPGRELSGRRFFVDSTSNNKGDDADHGSTVNTPFATIAYAVAQALLGSNRGDVVYVLPGHTETVTTAGGITMNVDGVHLVCMGSGRDRAVVTLSGSVAASINISADNCVIENMVIDATGIDSVGQGGSAAGAIEITGEDATVFNCEIIIATGSAQVKNAIGIATSANRCRILKNLIAGTKTAGPNMAIELWGNGSLTVEGLKIIDNYIVGDFATEAISINMTDVLLNAIISDNVVTATGTAQQCLAVTVGAGSSGVVKDNVFLGTDVTTVYFDTDIGLANVNNKGYDINTDGLLGVDVPIVGDFTIPEEHSLIDQILGEFSVNHGNHLLVTADLSSVTWNTIATHEVVHVIGTCRVIVLPTVVTDCTSGGAGTMSFGEEAAGLNLIAATAVALLTADKSWLSATPAKVLARSSVLDLIVGENDLGFAIAANAFTGGRIDFHIWWVPLESGAQVLAGTGGPL